MLVKAKMRCWEVAQQEHEIEKVSFYPVCGDTPENNTYAVATPSGAVSLTISNPAVKGWFEVGKEYLFDITPI